MRARSRFHAAVALALALALLTATGPLLGSAQHLLGATSASVSAAPDDDRGDGAVAIASHPLIVVALLVALTLVVRAGASTSGAVSEPSRARSPPSR